MHAAPSARTPVAPPPTPSDEQVQVALEGKAPHRSPAPQTSCLCAPQGHVLHGGVCKAFDASTMGCFSGDTLEHDTHTHSRKCVHAQVSAHTNTLALSRVCTSSHAHTNIHAHIYTSVYVHRCTHTFAQAFAHAHKHPYTSVHAHSILHTHTLMHTWLLSLWKRVSCLWTHCEVSTSSSLNWQKTNLTLEGSLKKCVVNFLDF